MKTTLMPIARWLSCLSFAMALSAAAAEDLKPRADKTPLPAANAQQEAGEPRVNTSSDVVRPTQADASATQASQAAPAAAAAKAAKASPNAADRVDLDTTTITGNRELPKVLYIVPWKRSDIGDLIGRPVNSLLDEVLAPVDRDVFRREVAYYQALKPDASSPAAGQGEK